jgi:hypothetical protein
MPETELSVASNAAELERLIRTASAYKSGLSVHPIETYI